MGSKETVLPALFERYFAEVYFYVKELVKEKEEIDNIVAQSFVALYRKLENGFSGDDNIRSFLSTTSRDLSLNYLKKVYHESGEIEVNI